MAVTPAIIALNASGIETAKKLAVALGAKVHGREGRVLEADVWFGNALDHVRDLFAAGVPIVGVCASGILIRAVAPLLNDKTAEAPVVSISDNGGVVVPHQYPKVRHRASALALQLLARAPLAWS